MFSQFLLVLPILFPLSPFSSNTNNWTLISKSKYISITADKDEPWDSFYNFTFRSFRLQEYYSDRCLESDDHVGIRFTSSLGEMFCRVVPHVESYGQWDEFTSEISHLYNIDANPANYRFTLVIWYTYTKHLFSRCEAYYVYRYQIYKRSEPVIKTIGTFQARFNNIWKYSDQTIKLTNSSYISGSKEAYQQAIYSTGDDEPLFIGLSADRFPHKYKKPPDLSLQFYNEFANKPIPTVYNIILQRVTINDQFTDYQQRYIGGYSTSLLKHTIEYNGPIIPNWEQKTIGLMFNRIDQSKDSTPPLDENDKLIPDAGEVPGVMFKIKVNDHFNQLKELYEENEPNSILNGYIFKGKWWREANLFYLEISNKPTTEPDREYTVSLVGSLVMVIFLIFAFLSLPLLIWTSLPTKTKKVMTLDSKASQRQIFRSKIMNLTISKKVFICFKPIPFTSN